MVAITASTPTAAEAGLTPGAFTVTRTGDTTDPLTVPYVVGGTATAGADYVALPGAVTIPAGAASAAIEVSPLDDTLVEPNETVVATISASAAYVIASGPGTVTITSDDAAADLVVASVAGPSVAGAGTTITMNDTTKNQGGGLSQASSTAFYLSKDFTIDAGDISLGSRNVPQLAAGASDTAATPLTVPAGTATGTYWVLAKADAGATNPESNENNNVKSGSTVGVGPDMVVSALTNPSGAAPGSSLSVTETTKNQGGGAAGASTTSFYLSANVLLDAADVLLGSRPVPALGVSGIDSATTTLTIPAGTVPGTYYIIGKADAGGAVVETQEGNNTKYGLAMRVGPDLVESNITPQAAGGAGAPFVITDTVKNAGSGNAGASTTVFYLSTNGTLDASDAVLGSRAVPPLGPTATSTGSTTVTIPDGTATGTWYILAKADANNDVPESAETNNLLYASTRIGPDLTVATVSVVSTAPAGATILITDTTKNAGGGAAPASTTRYYLSTNLTVDASDVLLGSRAVIALAAGASDTGSASVVIPASTPAGSYYILGVADGDGTVPESAETNNTRAMFIKITVGG
jgi:subtilase family serine protease